MTLFARAGRPTWDLALSSFLTLFFELVCVRWLTANVTLATYFSNTIVIGCFLGFGIGCLARERRFLFSIFPLLLLLFVSVVWGLSGLQFGASSHADEYFWGSGARFNWFWILPLVYVLLALLFVALGQAVGRGLDGFPPLRGYAINIAASLAGTVAFAALSFLDAGPVLWFVVCGLISLILLRKRFRYMIVGALLLVPAMMVVHRQEITSLWSPYYKITILSQEPAQSGAFALDVNNDFHQMALPLSDSSITRFPGLRSWRAVYDLPYSMLGRTPDSVLVLGAGTGNDVAAALRGGARHVTAVELDPLILKLGQHHPDRPYADSRVHPIVTDARQFLVRRRGSYDLIVLGFLDSHRLFSTMSNVRQDNFVYTEESMREMRRLLAPGGRVALSFNVGPIWVGKKIFDMLRAVYGVSPRVFTLPNGGYGLAGQTFIIGEGAANGSLELPPPPEGFREITNEYLRAPGGDIPTDNWPYLYYRTHSLSSDYRWTLVLLWLISTAVILIALPKKNLGGDPPARLAVMFFLGAGFLLLEMRNLTTLALSFGSTWLVTAVVISGLLVMVLAATLLVARGLAPRGAWPWIGLLLTFIVLWIWNGAPGDMNPLVHSGISTVIVSLSFLFSSIIFSQQFAAVRSPSVAFGVNLFGSVIGGLTEYLSLVLGMQAIILVAAAFYGAAYLLSWRRSDG